MHAINELPQPQGTLHGHPGLSRSNREVSRASRDHDLRNRLHMITGFAELLQVGYFGPVTASQREFLGYVLTAAAEAQALLRAPKQGGLE